MQGIRPAYHYARRHDYIFYPVAWVDQSTGTSYQAGYYDEDGKRYDSVAFKKGDNYENVVCHCPYCEQDTILNLTSEQVATQSLKCPNCNGQMVIQSALDEYTGTSESSSSEADEVKNVKKKNSTFMADVEKLYQKNTFNNLEVSNVYFSKFNNTIFLDAGKDDYKLLLYVSNCIDVLFD